MPTADKSEAVLKKIAEIANAKPVVGVTPNAVTFTRDWGGNSLTLAISGSGHTHIGDVDGTWEAMIDDLYNALHDGPGLSFT